MHHHNMIKISMNKNVYNVNIGMINWCSDHKAFSAKTPLKKPFKMSILNDKKARRMNFKCSLLTFDMLRKMSVYTKNVQVN